MLYLPPYLPESPLPRPSQVYLPLLSVQAHVNFRHEGGRERAGQSGRGGGNGGAKDEGSSCAPNYWLLNANSTWGKLLPVQQSGTAPEHSCTYAAPFFALALLSC